MKGKLIKKIVLNNSFPRHRLNKQLSRPTVWSLYVAHVRKIWLIRNRKNINMIGVFFMWHRGKGMHLYSKNHVRFPRKRQSHWYPKIIMAQSRLPFFPLKIPLRHAFNKDHNSALFDGFNRHILVVLFLWSGFISSDGIIKSGWWTHTFRGKSWIYSPSYGY